MILIAIINPLNEFYEINRQDEMNRQDKFKQSVQRTWKDLSPAKWLTHNF